MSIEVGVLGELREAIHLHLASLGFLSGPNETISLEAGWRSIGENSQDAAST